MQLELYDPFDTTIAFLLCIWKTWDALTSENEGLNGMDLEFGSASACHCTMEFCDDPQQRVPGCILRLPGFY